MHSTFSLTKDDEQINNFILPFQKKMEEFFSVVIDDPEILLVKSRQDIDMIWGKVTPDWLTAWVKEGKIFILDYNSYTQESSHKNPEHFWQTLKHELVHLYYQKLAGINYPKWLSEGLACYLAGQVKTKPTIDELFKIFDYFKKTDNRVYAIGYFWVSLLIKKFGVIKLLDLIKMFNKNMSDADLAEYFKQVYQRDFSKKGLMDLV